MPPAALTPLHQLADRICNHNRRYAEHSGYAFGTAWLAQMNAHGPTEYYDPNTGKLLFTAPVGRTVEGECTSMACGILSQMPQSSSRRAARMDGRRSATRRCAVRACRTGCTEPLCRSTGRMCVASRTASASALTAPIWVRTRAEGRGGGAGREGLDSSRGQATICRIARAIATASTWSVCRVSRCERRQIQLLQKIAVWRSVVVRAPFPCNARRIASHRFSRVPFGAHSVGSRRLLHCLASRAILVMACASCHGRVPSATWQPQALFSRELPCASCATRPRPWSLYRDTDAALLHRQ